MAMEFAELCCESGIFDSCNETGRGDDMIFRSTGLDFAGVIPKKLRVRNWDNGVGGNKMESASGH